MEDIIVYYSTRENCTGSARITEMVENNTIRPCTLVCLEHALATLEENGEPVPDWLNGSPICVETVVEEGSKLPVKLAYRGTNAIEFLRSGAEFAADAVSDRRLPVARETRVGTRHGDINSEGAKKREDASAASSRTLPTPGSDSPRRDKSRLIGDVDGDDYNTADREADVRLSRGVIMPTGADPRASLNVNMSIGTLESPSDSNDDTSGATDLKDMWTLEEQSKESDEKERKVTDDDIAAELAKRQIGGPV